MGSFVFLRAGLFLLLLVALLFPRGGLCVSDSFVVVERVLLGNASGVASSAVLSSPGPRHLLTVSPVGSALQSFFCVDLTCSTTLSAQLWHGPDGGGEPHVLPDRDRPPVVAFQHSQGAVVAFARCQDMTCQRFAWTRDVIAQSTKGDVFQVRGEKTNKKKKERKKKKKKDY